MISWMLVPSNLWHTMTMLEQSMSELTMDSLECQTPPSGPMLTREHAMTDDEFFKDIPIQIKASTKLVESDISKLRQVSPFTAYSFSQSTMMDEKGRSLVSIRRRYEDSSGYLKATHERIIDGKCCTYIRNRKNKEDEGELQSICYEVKEPQFNEEWMETPFGKKELEIIKKQEIIDFSQVNCKICGCWENNCPHCSDSKDKRKYDSLQSKRETCGYVEKNCQNCDKEKSKCECGHPGKMEKFKTKKDQELRKHSQLNCETCACSKEHCLYCSSCGKKCMCQQMHSKCEKCDNMKENCQKCDKEKSKCECGIPGKSKEISTVSM